MAFLFTRHVISHILMFLNVNTKLIVRLRSTRQGISPLFVSCGYNASVLLWARPTLIYHMEYSGEPPHHRFPHTRFTQMHTHTPPTSLSPTPLPSAHQEQTGFCLLFTRERDKAIFSVVNLAQDQLDPRWEETALKKYKKNPSEILPQHNLILNIPSHSCSIFFFPPLLPL